MSTERYEFKLTIKEPGGEAREFSIPLGVTTIGRGAAAAVRLNETRVSRLHAQLECDGVECSITDMESANGTQVDGEKLQPRVPRVLGEQAEIRIEGFTLQYRRIALEIVDSEPVPIPQPVSEEISTGPRPIEIEAPEVVEELPTQLGYVPPPGLSLHSERLLQFLPDIYHTDFLSRFLALFESILVPVEWNIGSFDLFLTPGTAPPPFLIWLSKWFDLKVGSGWDESKQRTMLTEAHQLYARRGSPWALKRVLQIYLEQEPEIVEQTEDLEPFTFRVILPSKAREVNQDVLKRIIDEFKPAYTNYSLEFKG